MTDDEELAAIQARDAAATTWMAQVAKDRRTLLRLLNAEKLVSATLGRVGDQLLKERDEARAENERLREALMRYGNHTDECACFNVCGENLYNEQCDCGLQQLLHPAALETPAQPTESAKGAE